MSDQVTKLAPPIWSEIQKANKILMTLHPGPDLDSIGSVLGMSFVLEKFGKKIAVISGDDPPPENAKHLPGFDKIQNKTFDQVDLSNFDLFLAIDSASPSQITKKLEIKFPLAIPTISIDHHASSTKFAELELVDPSISSSSELVYYLVKFKEENLLDKNSASCLFLGMWGDTGAFRFPQTTGNSYKAAGKLIELGIDITSLIYNASSSPLKQVKLLGYGLYSAEKYFNTQVIISKIPFTIYESLGFTTKTTGSSYHSIANELSNCSDYTLAAVLHEKEPEKTGISLRSNNPATQRDTTPIAKLLGGGGHKFASGAMVVGGVEEAQKALFEAIQKIYPDLGQP